MSFDDGFLHAAGILKSDEPDAEPLCDVARVAIENFGKMLDQRDMALQQVIELEEENQRLRQSISMTVAKWAALWCASIAATALCVAAVLKVMQP